MVVRDIQESQKGIACVTCVACITCMACIGRNAAQDGRRCRIERRQLAKLPQGRLGEQGRQASRSPDASEVGVRGAIWGPSHWKLCAT